MQTKHLQLIACAIWAVIKNNKKHRRIVDIVSSMGIRSPDKTFMINHKASVVFIDAANLNKNV